MKESVYAIIGASGCGRGIMPLARRQLESMGGSSEDLVFIDDRLAGGQANGHLILSHEEFVALPAKRHLASIAISNNSVREQVAQRCAGDGIMPWSIFAENIVVMDDVTIGDGAIISPFATLTSNISIGRHFHANLYSYVEHDCVIGDFVTFAPGVKCNGNVHIGNHAYIGSGAVIRQGKPGAPIRIGEGAVIGMGAVVINDVPAGATVVGNPARTLLVGNR